MRATEKSWGTGHDPDLVRITLYAFTASYTGRRMAKIIILSMPSVCPYMTCCMEPRQPVPVTPTEHEVNKHTPISHYHMPHNKRKTHLTGLISRGGRRKYVISMSLQYSHKSTKSTDQQSHGGGNSG